MDTNHKTSKIYDSRLYALRCVLWSICVGLLAAFVAVYMLWVHYTSGGATTTIRPMLLVLIGVVMWFIARTLFLDMPKLLSTKSIEIVSDQVLICDDSIPIASIFEVRLHRDLGYDILVSITARRPDTQNISVGIASQNVHNFADKLVSINPRIKIFDTSSVEKMNLIMRLLLRRW